MNVDNYLGPDHYRHSSPLVPWRSLKPTMNQQSNEQNWNKHARAVQSRPKPWTLCIIKACVGALGGEGLGLGDVFGRASLGFYDFMI